MTDVRMLWFHVRQFAQNGYFVQLLITTTLGMVALQALAARAPGAAAVGQFGYGQGWLRAGMLGTWTVCAVASGMLGYQRYLGTLVHLVRTPHRAVRTLLPVLGAASVFGLLALPLAALASWALRQPVTIGGIALGHGQAFGVNPFPIATLASTILAGLVFWIACFSISVFLGMLFVLTPNATTYEGLISIPLVLISGVFGTQEFIPDAVTTVARILPTRSAVELLQQITSGLPLSVPLIVESLGVSLLWLTATVIAANMVTKRATVTGTLEVV